MGRAAHDPCDGLLCTSATVMPVWSPSWEGEGGGGDVRRGGVGAVVRGREAARLWLLDRDREREEGLAGGVGWRKEGLVGAVGWRAVGAPDVAVVDT